MKAHETELAAQLILAQTDSEVDTETDAATETKVEVGKGMQRLGRYSELSDDQRTLLAQTINEADLTWKADPYISIAEPEGVMGFAQTDSEAEANLNARSHARTHSKHFNDGSEEFDRTMKEAQAFLNTPLSQITLDQIGGYWDWSNVNGYDFTSRHID